jgi:hypothetical protein
MPLLAANGVELQLASFNQKELVMRGENVRAFANNLMVGSDSGAREWDGETIPLTLAECASLKASLTSGNVVLTGDLMLGQPATVHVTVRSIPFTPARDDATGAYTAAEGALSLTFQEI